MHLCRVIWSDIDDLQQQLRIDVSMCEWVVKDIPWIRRFSLGTCIGNLESTAEQDEAQEFDSVYNRHVRICVDMLICKKTDLYSRHQLFLRSFVAM